MWGIVVAVVAAMMLAAGVGVTISEIRSRGGLPGTHPGIHTGDIRDDLLPMPAGSRPWNLDYGVDGLLSKDEAARFMGAGPGSLDHIATDCKWEAGAIRAWVDASGREVVERMFRLAGPSYAQQFLEETRGSEITGVRRASSHDLNDEHKITGVTLGFSLMYPTPNSHGYRNMLSMGTKGDTAFIFIIDTLQPVDPAFAASLVHQQADRL